jgi:RNA recognition motif-containing protein
MTGTRVCVKNVPKHVTEARLKEHFAAKGEVTDVKLLKTRSAAAPFPSRLLVSPPGGGRSGAARVRQAVAGACCYVHACPCDRVYLRSSPTGRHSARHAEQAAGRGGHSDGKSRQMAFLGFRSAEQAAMAVTFFNRTYLDTSKLQVEVRCPGRRL